MLWRWRACISMTSSETACVMYINYPSTSSLALFNDARSSEHIKKCIDGVLDKIHSSGYHLPINLGGGMLWKTMQYIRMLVFSYNSILTQQPSSPHSQLNGAFKSSGEGLRSRLQACQWWQFIFPALDFERNLNICPCTSRSIRETLNGFACLLYSSSNLNSPSTLSRSKLCPVHRNSGYK